MEKKHIITVVTGLLFAFLIASCGSSEKAEEKEADGKEAEETKPDKEIEVNKREALPKKERVSEEEKPE